MSKERQRIGFIGAGRVGTALAAALSRAGYPVVAVFSRSERSSRNLASTVDACQVFADAQAVVDAADLVFLTTPDDTLRALANSLRWSPATSVVHTSGAESIDVLESAARQGSAVGSLHPLQTFADLDQARENLRGSVFAVEADGALRKTLLGMVEALGGSAIELRPDEKALYHAAAVLVSNYTVTLVKAATDLWLRFGWERHAALRALLPLLRGTLENLEHLGVPGALTGPIARGDVTTVGRHLASLRDAAPELVAAYRELALLTIPVALAKGGLSDEDAAALRALLDETPCRARTEGAKTA